MSKPSNYDEAVFQKRINSLVGTKDGRPLILLDWAPNRFRWYPHRLGTDPAGYAFPSFCNSAPLVSPDRWGLWMRNEREQYGPLWEATRYMKLKGQVWDIKGPCPPEKYTELKLHACHDTDCCPCDGYDCTCDDHCHGKYAEPNEFLFDWIRKVAYEALRDPDVQPTEDARFLETPHAQREVANTEQRVQEQMAEEDALMGKELDDYIRRHPISTSSLKRTDGGIYLLTD